MEATNSMPSCRNPSLVLAALLIAGCAGQGPRPPPGTPAPVRLAADLCTPPADRPARPRSAGLVRPATAAERAATAALLGWIAALIDHDQMLAARARRTAQSPACRGG